MPNKDDGDSRLQDRINIAIDGDPYKLSRATLIKITHKSDPRRKEGQESTLVNAAPINVRA